MTTALMAPDIEVKFAEEDLTAAPTTAAAAASAHPSISAEEMSVLRPFVCAVPPAAVGCDANLVAAMTIAMCVAASSAMFAFEAAAADRKPLDRVLATCSGTFLGLLAGTLIGGDRKAADILTVFLVAPVVMGFAIARIAAGSGEGIVPVIVGALLVTCTFARLATPHPRPRRQ